MKSKLPLLIIIFLAALLRLWDLPHFPAGLNADEAAIGYNAYSLTTTGHDEHGVSWPLEFRSFDDFKPPFYFYLVLPFVYILGVTPLAVRLPSALLGILAVYLTYLLANHLFKRSLKLKGFDLNFGHLSALLLAISPWHLHFSRGGWEANSATTLLLLGLYLFLRAKTRPSLLPFAAITLVLSLYTYHSLRVLVPFFGAYLLFTNKDFLLSLKARYYTALSALLGVLLLIPLVLQFTTGSAASRFSGVGLLADPGPLSWVLEHRRLSDDPYSLITRLKYNRYSAYSFRFLQNYLSHFSPDFLFFKGDEIARSKVPGFGQSYLYLLPFFYLGLLTLILKPKHSPNNRLLLVWLATAPIAAALTFQSPHALRAQNMSIPLALTTALGVCAFFYWVRAHLPHFLYLTAFLIFTILTLSSFKTYLNAYYYRYPQELGYAWQYGFEQLSSYVKQNENKYERVLITTSYDQPYILLAFFLRYPPALLQQELIFSPPDQYGFATGTSFGKYIFKSIDATDFQLPGSLVVLGRETPPPNLEPLQTINYPNGQPVFRLYSTTQNLAVK